MKTTLFYFSGTGNSLTIARQLNKKIQNCELIPIAKAIREDSPLTSSEKVGFVFPLYYYGLPKIVYDFVNKLKLDETNYVFAVVTKAGEVDGVPLIQLERILRTKSKNLNAGFFVIMPDNFTLDSHKTSEEEMKLLFENVGSKVEEISKNIEGTDSNLNIELIEGKKYKYERGNRNFHRNVNKGDASFFADENCTSCGICEEICPVDNIELVDGKPQWQHLCQQCLACMNFCPEFAIQFGKNTTGRTRYHHPEITSMDIINQKK
jgi:ferredoxin